MDVIGVDVEGEEAPDTGLAQAAGDRGAGFTEADKSDGGNGWRGHLSCRRARPTRLYLTG